MTNKRRILITGASRGIGKAIALGFKDDRFELALHYHSNLNAIQEVAKQLKEIEVPTTILQFDCKNRSQCQAVLQQDIDQNGPYYGVIFNAGICKDNAFPALTDEDWDDVINTNLNGFYHVIKPCIMPMVRAKKGGRIITMSSIAGLTGNRGQTNYSASKAGIIAATKSLALELGKRNITANCIAPGIIETDMTKSLHDNQMILDQIPLRRFGNAHEVASLAHFLLSDQASYITRQVISVNGGMI